MANTWRISTPDGMARFDLKLPAHLCDRLEAMAKTRETDAETLVSLLLARIDAQSDLFAQASLAAAF